MSSVPPGGWDPDDTGAVPVGPEPEPTGVGGEGSGGWGEAPRTEPFAIAALVWAIVSIILPIVGTIVALVLAARASDSIRRSQGTRSGTNLVNAARIIAGVVIALWAIGGITYLATRDDSSSSDVATPTQPTTSTSTTRPVSTTTTRPITTTTTLTPVSTTQVQPTVTVGPTTPPTTAPPTTAPPTTAPPTTAPPTTAPPTTAPPTTQAPTTTTEHPTTTTTSPQQVEARITEKLLSPPSSSSIGPSNRGLPDDERVVVSYTPGQPLVITWGINNGSTPLTGTAECLPPTSTSTTSSSTTSSSSTTTTQPASTTPQVARTEARRILNAIKAELNNDKLDIDGLQIVGTYPIEGGAAGESEVVKVFFSNAVITGTTWNATKDPFAAPPATTLECINPAFD